MQINKPREHFIHQRDEFGVFTPVDNEDWAAARTQSIGGSDISTVMGLWGREQFNELLEEKRTGVQFFTGNLRTWVGSSMEGPIYRRFRDGKIDNMADVPSGGVMDWNSINAIRFDEFNPAFSCTPDIEIGDEIRHGVIDLTAVINMKFTGKWLKSMLPEHMVMQVNWEMMVCRVEVGGILALHLGYGEENPDYLRYFPVEHDPALIKRMREAATIFMDGVRSGAEGDEIAKAIGIEWTPKGSIKGSFAKKEKRNVNRDF